MTNERAGLSELSDLVGRAVARRRKEELRISIEELAERCAAKGAPQLTVNTLYVIEGGRREAETGRRRRLITIDECFALAAALDLNLVDLLVPPQLGDDEPYAIAPGLTVTARRARQWIAGTRLLEDATDMREWARLLAHMPEERANKIFGHGWQDTELNNGMTLGQIAAEEGAD